MSALIDGRPAHRGPLRRLDAVLGPPVWWGCHLGVSYWLIPRLCRWSVHWPLHVLTVALLVLIARALLSGLQLIQAGRAACDEPGAARDVFIGWVGAAFALLFGAVTVAEWIPSLFLDPCW
jgi:hypothetical protein